MSFLRIIHSIFNQIVSYYAHSEWLIAKLRFTLQAAVDGPHNLAVVEGEITRMKVAATNVRKQLKNASHLPQLLTTFSAPIVSTSTTTASKSCFLETAVRHIEFIPTCFLDYS